MASEPPLILAFDTSAAHCAAALVQGARILARRDEPMERGQAERLLPMLEEMLAEAGVAWKALDGIAVATGPGNFTGLRLAVAAARGLALALGIPAVGVSLFEALSAGLPGPVLVVLPERGGGHAAQLLVDGVPTAAALRGDPAGLGPFAEATLCLGQDARAIASRLGLGAGPEAVRADPAAIAAVAAPRLGKAPPPAPLYLRPADALPSSDPIPLLLDDA